MRRTNLYLLLTLYFLSTVTLRAPKSTPELTVMGHIDPQGGIGRLPIELATCLKDDLSINFISSRRQSKQQLLSNPLPLFFRKIVENSSSLFAPVTIYQDILWFPGHNYFATVPLHNSITIAYSMFESTALPPQWVQILNKRFDAVVVPDQWLVNVYVNSGVTIPIFVIPVSLNLEHFMQEPVRRQAHKPFIFGCAAAFAPRKNYELLVESFAQAFGNSRDVRLRINSRYSNPEILSTLTQKINKYRLTNVEITNRELSDKDYMALLRSFDCYVALSEGEGYSIPPREMLALGIPIIVSDNTAHHTICSTGFVRCVPTTIQVPAYYPLFRATYGSFFSGTPADGAAAFRDVYNNYPHYLSKAQNGRDWVAQYLPRNLKKYYLTLAKPKRVTVGNTNQIFDGYIQTTSEKLRRKYQQLVQAYGLHEEL